MSRSYRAGWYTDGYKSHGNRKRLTKRQANRRVRHAPEVWDGNMYRRLFNPWDICDYKFPYNPNPRVWFYRGKQEIIEPLPFWRVLRK